VSTSSCIEASRQRGEFLIEALVSLVLVAIVGLGSTYVASRVSVAQRAQSVQNNALAQMRDILKTRQAADLCAGTNIPTVVLGSTTVTPSVSCSTSTVTLGSGASAATVTSPQMVTLTLSGSAIASLIGGSGSLVVSN
jgi:prepilin peptidase dependent protein A